MRVEYDRIQGSARFQPKVAAVDYLWESQEIHRSGVFTAECPP